MKSQSSQKLWAPLLAITLGVGLLIGAGCDGGTVTIDRATSGPSTGTMMSSSTGMTVPTLPELADGWTEFQPGGETVCSRGAPYAYFVRKGTVNKVVIDFIGGGACWNALTCGFADAIFEDSVDSVRARVEAGIPSGFYDDTRDDNPFKDWYHVVVPYCTGDIHWGNNVQTYGSGANEVTINHKGAVNTRAVLDWVYENFSAPEKTFVTGCSAGSYGSAMWAPHIADRYPDTEMIQFGDSGAGVITQTFFEDSFPSWKAEGAFPTFIPALDPAEVNLLDLQLPDLYIGIANHFPQHRFSQFNTIIDENQVFFFTAMGGSGEAEWTEKMRASLATIEAGAPQFSSFVGPGDQHCILPFDNFFDVEADGVKLVDWVDQLVNGEVPDDVACSGCQ